MWGTHASRCRTSTVLPSACSPRSFKRLPLICAGCLITDALTGRALECCLPGARNQCLDPQPFAPPPVASKLIGGPLAWQIPIAHASDRSRTGAFYLPSKFRKRSVPVLLAFHGIYGSGREMVDVFRVRAAAWRLAAAC